MSLQFISTNFELAVEYVANKTFGERVEVSSSKPIHRDVLFFVIRSKAHPKQCAGFGMSGLELRSGAVSMISIIETKVHQCKLLYDRMYNDGEPVRDQEIPL